MSIDHLHVELRFSPNRPPSSPPSSYACIASTARKPCKCAGLFELLQMRGQSQLCTLDVMCLNKYIHTHTERANTTDGTGRVCNVCGRYHNNQFSHSHVILGKALDNASVDDFSTMLLPIRHESRAHNTPQNTRTHTHTHENFCTHYRMTSVTKLHTENTTACVCTYSGLRSHWLRLTQEYNVHDCPQDMGLCVCVSVTNIVGNF